MFSLKAPLLDLGGVARSITCLMATLIASLGAPALAQWPQFGGPNRDFTSASTGLADEWPEGGPRKLGHRELGAGYSAIVCDEGVLYTMYRKNATDEVEYTVALADHVYGATDRLLLAVDFATGKRVWAKRGFPSASCVHADGKLIILDENGWLTLATATPEDLTVHSKHQITERYSFSVPTLARTTLFVRDRKHIMALDLG